MCTTAAHCQHASIHAHLFWFYLFLLLLLGEENRRLTLVCGEREQGFVDVREQVSACVVLDGVDADGALQVNHHAAAHVSSVLIQLPQTAARLAHVL